MIQVTIHLSCGGCHKSEDVKLEDWLRMEFHSVSGRSYGFGHYVTTWPKVPNVPGWTLFDPHTKTTYCTKCMDEIEDDAESTDKARESGEEDG